MPRLVVFDCDGVMFDSLEANRRYYNHLLARFGHGEMGPEELGYVHSHNVMDSVARVFAPYPGDILAAHRYREGLDYTPFFQYMRMEPDLVAFLSFLRPHRLTAISTNRTSTMAQVLAAFNLGGLFDMVVTALDVARPKPHPEALHKILAAFGLEPAEALYIGDSAVDQQHAAAAGVPFVAFRNPELPALYHVDSFTELMRVALFAGHDPAA